jgi:predicted PurR-regulated permease PerM
MDFIITLITFAILLVVIFCLSLFFYRIQNQITTILERQHNDLISQLDNLKNIEQQGLTILQGIDLKLSGLEKSLNVNHNLGLKLIDSNVLIIISTTIIIILAITVLVNISSTNGQIVKVFEEQNLIKNNLDNSLNVLNSYNEKLSQILLSVSDIIASLNRSLSQIGPDAINNTVTKTQESTAELVENVVKTFVENDEVLTKFSTNVVTTLVKNDELLSTFVENTVSTIVLDEELLTIIQGIFPNF